MLSLEELETSRPGDTIVFAGLKQQYISKIDQTQEKYSIDHLFTNVEYADVDPNVFALYAATDSMMDYIITEDDSEVSYKDIKEIIKK